MHVALRGRTGDGGQLEFNRDYIKEGIRAIAEDCCTRQLGYRTAVDRAEAERREIAEKRFTSLERSILRRAERGHDGWLCVRPCPVRPTLRDNERTHEAQLASRLTVLESMGLAPNAGADGWRVRGDFEGVLRAMQRAGDHQKTVNAHGALVG